MHPTDICSSVYSQILLDPAGKEQVYYGVTFQRGDERLDYEAVTQDRAALEELSRLILTQDVDFIHIPDVMEDFAAACVTVI